MRIYYLQTITNTGKKFATDDNGKLGITTNVNESKVFSTKREASAACKKLNLQVKAVFTVQG